MMKLRSKLRDNPLSPPQILAIGFFIIITLGTLFLKLPISRSMPLDDQLWGSFFQGLTPRTAGFNSLDYSQMNPSTLMLTIFLMFIGGGERFNCFRD